MCYMMMMGGFFPPEGAVKLFNGLRAGQKIRVTADSGSPKIGRKCIKTIFDIRGYSLMTTDGFIFTCEDWKGITPLKTYVLHPATCHIRAFKLQQVLWQREAYEKQVEEDTDRWWRKFKREQKAKEKARAEASKVSDSAAPLEDIDDPQLPGVFVPITTDDIKNMATEMGVTLPKVDLTQEANAPSPFELFP